MRGIEVGKKMIDVIRKIKCNSTHIINFIQARYKVLHDADKFVIGSDGLLDRYKM